MFIALDQLEQAVIGAVLLHPENLAILPTLSTPDLAGYRAKATWEAIRNLEHAGRPIDTTTVGAELERAGKLESVGWAYLGECSLACPTPTNAIEYAKLIRDAALKRRIVESLTEVMQAAKDGATGAELLTLVMGGMSVLDAEQPEDASTVGDVVKRRVKQLETIAAERANGTRTMTGFPTGVAKLDEKLGGWQPGIVSIVAARPGMGKSSLGLATADGASKAGFGVHLFSLEDTEESYADRVLSRTSRVPAEDIRNCSLTSDQLDKVSHSLRAVSMRRSWLVDGRSGITAEEIVRSVRRRKRENNTCVVIVDYVQLVKPSKSGRFSTHEALTETVTTFADAAKADKVAYVVMSQLNRDIEKRQDKRPQLADLRESGSLEERAKCVVGMYRGAYYGKPQKGIDYPENESAPSEQEFPRQVQLLVLKNSNGRTGVVRATWDGPTTRVE